MPLLDPFNEGTASVANGATTVTVTGASVDGIVVAGGTFADPSQPAIPPQRVASDALSDGTFTLWAPWPGTSLTSDPYEYRPTSDATRYSERVRDLLDALSVVEANGRGLFYVFSTTTTDSDPGAGKFRLNNATQTSATAAYLDNLDADGATVSAVLDTWDDLGTTLDRGQFWVRSISNPSTFRAYAVSSSVVDGTGYRKLTLAHIGGSGTLADGDEVMISFAPTGSAGETGPTGADGGITMVYSTTTTAADPGAGKFRLNNATHASATAAYIDNAEAAGGTISGLLDTWDDSTATIKGTLTIIDQDAPANWRAYSVTGSIVDSTGYRTVTLAYVAGNGTLGDLASCSLFFSRTGNNGANGTNGTNGVTSGLRYAFSTTTTDSDPGAGTLRLNNATMASVTAAYVDNVDSDGATVTGTLDTWDDSTNSVRGVLTVRSAGTPATFAQFNVTGSVVDGTGYRKLTLAHLSSNGTLGNGDAISVEFARTGNDGAAGFPDIDRRNQLLSMANGAKALAAYQRFLDCVAFGYKAAGDLDATSTLCTVDTSAGCAKPSSSGGGAVGPSGGAGGGAYNSSTGTNSGNGKTPAGYGGGAGAAAGAVTSAGIGQPGAPGLIVVGYTPSGGSLKVVSITSGTSWTVPSDWNNSSNTIDAYGAGGASGDGANNGAAGAGGGGGEGGAHARITNLTLTPGASITIAIGAAASATDGSDTWFNGANLAASSVGAKGGKKGTNASGTTPGVGGATSGGNATASVGTSKHKGGIGGAGGAQGGGGGGGCGGPNGDGKDGAAGVSSSGGGGGAANNGSAASGQSGGNGRGATGAGVAGQPGTNAGTGTGAGGGGATAGTGSQANLTGGSGAQDDVSTTTATISNGTAIDPYQTADAARTKVRGTFEIDPIDAITLGTDWTVEYTCNGGTNWHAATTYTNCGKGQSGRTVVETDEVTCTSGTSWSSRKKNLNNKDVRIYKTATKAAA